MESAYTLYLRVFIGLSGVFWLCNVSWDQAWFIDHHPSYNVICHMLEYTIIGTVHRTGVTMSASMSFMASNGLTQPCKRV